jgi:hypothetical protein
MRFVRLTTSQAGYSYSWWYANDGDIWTQSVVLNRLRGTCVVIGIVALHFDDQVYQVVS